MSDVKRNCIIGIVVVLGIIGAVILYQNLILNGSEGVIESKSTLYELVSKEKFLTQSPIIAEFETISAEEKSMTIDKKNIPTKEYEISANKIYKGVISEKEHITMYDDRYKASLAVINNNNEVIYETSSGERIQLQPNEEYLLFLMPSTVQTDKYQLFCGFQGIFTYDEVKQSFVNVMGVEITYEDLLGI